MFTTTSKLLRHWYPPLWSIHTMLSRTNISCAFKWLSKPWITSALPPFSITSQLHESRISLRRCHPDSSHDKDPQPINHKNTL